MRALSADQRATQGPTCYVGVRTPGFSHYYPAYSRAEADDLAQRASTHAPGRVWIEGELSASGRKRIPATQLSAETVAARLEAIDSRFVLSAAEQQRCEAARQITDAASWRALVAQWVNPILTSYAARELELEDALALIDRISIGCLPQARMQLLGTFAYLARRTPRTAGQPRGNPSCVRVVTAEMVLFFRQAVPTLTPAAAIDRALETLTLLEWLDTDTEKHPTPETVAGWVRARLADMGEGRSKGRPPGNARGAARQRKRAPSKN